MSRLLVAVLCLEGVFADKAVLSATAQAREQSLETEWSKILDPETKNVAYQSPIKRVIAMLERMRTELENEQAKEAEMYDKMVCWCETGEKEKTKAIHDAEAKDNSLTSEIEACSARFGELATKIEHMKKQIVSDTDALKEATAIRINEVKAFQAEEKDMVSAIANLDNAINVLSKHQGSFLQLDGSLRSGMQVLLRGLAEQHEALMASFAERHAFDPKPAGASFITKESKNVKESVQNMLAEYGANSDALPIEFAQKVIAEAAKKPVQGSAFLQASRGPNYASQSDGIFGIMSQMMDDFKAQLATLQSDEVKGKEDFEHLSATKNDQIARGKDKLDDLEAEHSANQKALSDAKEDLEMTREQRTSDVEYLRKLKQTCDDLDHQWAERSKTRSMETKAVSEALAIITDDDNKEQLDKSVSLLQESQSASIRNRVVARLRRAAEDPDFDTEDLEAEWKNHATKKSPAIEVREQARERFSTLAVAARMDGFGKIKKTMDNMIDTLKDEQKNEADYKISCQDKINENEKLRFQTKTTKEDLEAKIDDLDATMKKMAEEIDADTKMIADTQIEIKKASEQREKENAEFQTVVADQRATQNILNKALDKLNEFYKKGSALIQIKKTSQTPPVQFGAMKKNSGASPVINMIEQIVEEAAALEKEAMETETSAQADYESLLQKSNAEVDAANEAITVRTKTIADSKYAKAKAMSSLESAYEELHSLEQYKLDLHDQCDYVLNHFDESQAARAEEMKGIDEAKAYLGGMGGH